MLQHVTICDEHERRQAICDEHGRRQAEGGLRRAAHFRISQAATNVIYTAQIATSVVHRRPPVQYTLHLIQRGTPTNVISAAPWAVSYSLPANSTQMTQVILEQALQRSLLICNKWQCVTMHSPLFSKFKLQSIVAAPSFVLWPNRAHGNTDGIFIERWDH